MRSGQYKDVFYKLCFTIDRLNVTPGYGRTNTLNNFPYLT